MQTKLNILEYSAIMSEFLKMYKIFAVCTNGHGHGLHEKGIGFINKGFSQHT